MVKVLYLFKICIELFFVLFFKLIILSFLRGVWCVLILEFGEGIIYEKFIFNIVVLVVFR